MFNMTCEMNKTNTRKRPPRWRFKPKPLPGALRGGEALLAGGEIVSGPSGEGEQGEITHITTRRLKNEQRRNY